MIVAAQSANQQSDQRVIQRIMANREALNTATEEDLIAEIATLIVELNPNIRIATHASQDWLFGDGNLAADRDQVYVENDVGFGRMRPLRIVLKDQSYPHSTNGNVTAD